MHEKLLPHHASSAKSSLHRGRRAIKTNFEQRLRPIDKVVSLFDLQEKFDERLQDGSTALEEPTFLEQ